MSPDKSEKHELRLRKQKKMEELAQKVRSTEDIEAEEELLKKTEKVAPIHADKTVSRNDPCPCGSGKKYKKCCGQGN
jgi:preprotein translocase subunit SecA